MLIRLILKQVRTDVPWGECRVPINGEKWNISIMCWTLSAGILRRFSMSSSLC
jgi:hypothetical protein